MPGRLAVDFGTSNTVAAVWDDARQEGTSLLVTDFGRRLPASAGSADGVAVVPSLIHYAEENRRWLGDQVLSRNLYVSPRTFRWMKRYIGRRSPTKVRVDGREVSHFDAGRDFLSAILTFAAGALQLRDEEVAFTVPVEAFEHYENWLAEVAETAGMPRFRLIDEPSAAALGYGAHIQPGDVYLVFDLGGGTLDVAVVLIEDDNQGQTGRRCRVLGKAGADLGGATLDQWLFQDVLKRNQRSDADEDVRQLSRALLVECERAKERLSSHDQAEISVLNPHTGAVLAASYTQKQFEDLLDDNQFFTQLDQTIRRALDASRERGYAEEHVKAVLLVGGGSLIPSVQRTLQRIFGRERVLLDRPLDAVARGAAAFIAGVDFFDHIQHDYSIRHFDPKKGEHQYRVLVQHGTPYPTAKPVARMKVKASLDGQTQLGIAIFEIGERRRSAGSQPLELVFDPSGAARMVQLAPDDEETRTHFWINEETPTFLVADPPARQGDPRFEVEFGIDGNKRLLITARDLKTKRLTHQDYPVIKLT